MADRIIKLIENPDIMDKFKAQNLTDVKAYSTESVIDQMIKIYKELNLI